MSENPLDMNGGWGVESFNLPTTNPYVKEECQGMQPRLQTRDIEFLERAWRDFAAGTGPMPIGILATDYALAFRELLEHRRNARRK